MRSGPEKETLLVAPGDNALIRDGRSGTVEDEIRRARALYKDHGGSLAAVNGSLDLLDKVQKAILKTGEVMERLEVTAACSRCADAELGSCCFEGVEEWYDHILLYINLVMGVDPPESREIPDGCLFVGVRGCKLAARHAFCINYLCPSLHCSLNPSEKALLGSAAGEELLLAWELEKAIRRRLPKSRA